MADEYELLPASELEALREEVELLKANSFGNTDEAKTLLEGIQQLNDNINRLIKVFSDVDQEMVAEYNKVKSVDEQYHDLQEQNKKIASGILTVANLIEDVKNSAAEQELVPDFSDVPSPPTPEPEKSSVPDQEINFNPVPPGQTPPPLTTGTVSGFGNSSQYSNQGNQGQYAGQEQAPFQQSPAFSGLPPYQDPFETHVRQPVPVDPWAPQPRQNLVPQNPNSTVQPSPFPQSPHSVQQSSAPQQASPGQSPLPVQPSPFPQPPLNDRPPLPGEQSAMPNAVPPFMNGEGISPPQQSFNTNQPSAPPSFDNDPFAGSGLSRPPEPPKKKGLFGLFS